MSSLASLALFLFIFPTPLVGGRNNILIWFFLFGQFWPINIFIVEMRVVSLKSSCSLEFEIKRFFLNIVFFEELSRIEVMCEKAIFA